MDEQAPLGSEYFAAFDCETAGKYKAEHGYPLGRGGRMLAEFFLFHTEEIREVGRRKGKDTFFSS